MARADLLALTIADLESLTNRGTVKRAQREVESATQQVAVNDDDGTLTFTWPDGIQCTLGRGHTLREGRCSCAATSLCRHLIQSVLAYQRSHAGQPAPLGPWDPGTIADAELEKHFTKAKLAAARRRLKQGILVDLVRGAKPWARFEDDQCTLRFLVPGDLRYVTCDCAESAPCPHVPLAVWAFRELPTAKEAGVVPLGWHDLEAPLALLDDIEQGLSELCQWGVAGLNRNWRDRLIRLEQHARDAGLIWPAEVLADMLLLFDAYHAHDARFAPALLSQNVGELLIRLDAIRARTGAVPQVWIRGSKADRPTELAASRLIGLGCAVVQERKSARLLVFLQDSDTGSLAAVEKEVADPPPESADAPRSFRALGQLNLAGSISVMKLGEGQLLVRGAKRLPSHRLLLPRGQKGQVNPQSFAWEKLRAPLLAEDFAEVHARLASLPPASLRPRRVTENLQVCPIARVEAAHFNPINQCVEAILIDNRGQQAWLRHPFTSRGQEGTEALLELLTMEPLQVRFVAGHVQMSGQGLELAPTSVVSDHPDGRRCLQPWLGATGKSQAPLPAAMCLTRPGLLAEFHGLVRAALGQTLVNGVEKADGASSRTWNEIEQRADALGFLRLRDCVGRWIALLASRGRRVDWKRDDAIGQLKVLLALGKLGEDVQTLCH